MSATAVRSGLYVARISKAPIRRIYFAGSETTSLAASWTLMLLLFHPEWQERVQAEIVGVCGDHVELKHCL
ncbi:hypothetical protein M0R45_024809 [Rubus argutus]|uniref:Cytochrome P450 n=1 Tax=Rubus argutus TaxID=59490 RepID=A0AAW1WTS5_RUBAR